jgi:hypothetical protein
MWKYARGRIDHFFVRANIFFLPSVTNTLKDLPDTNHCHGR